MDATHALIAQMQQHRESGLWRERRVLDSAQSVTPVIDGRTLLSFCSNDYLGLANHTDIATAFKEAIDRYGVGAGASHFINGHHREHEHLEAEIARFCQREAALVFSSGYAANLSVIATLLSRQDTVIQDKLNHASLVDGALLSQAKLCRYRHNDMASLEQRLERASGQRLIVTDGVFSMDGNTAQLARVAQLAQHYQAWVLVDDAHGFGVLGDQGRGLVNACQLNTQQIPIVMGTLGKAFGTSGAFVAADQAIIDYLTQFARPYMYTTASLPALAAATRVALTLVQNSDARRAHLTKLITYFREQVNRLGIPLMPSMTPIQPIVVGTNERALYWSAQLEKQGILVTAIRPPTVPKGSARLRVTFSAQHTFDQVDRLLNALDDLR